MLPDSHLTLPCCDVTLADGRRKGPSAVEAAGSRKSLPETD